MFLGLVTSILVTAAALYLSLKLHPAPPSNFNLFGGHDLLAAILAGVVYGGVLGVIVSFISGIVYIAIVYFISAQINALWTIVGVSVFVAMLEGGFFLLDNHIHVGDDDFYIAIYLFVSGFITAFVPLFITHKVSGSLSL